MNAICLVIDRLHLGCLGAYGNSWIQTPCMDRLASQSLVFDQAVIDSPRLPVVCRSYWQGLHAFCPETSAGSHRSLPGLLSEAGARAVLLTDESQVARHALVGDFDELLEIEPTWQPETAEDVEQTHFARCFMQIIQRMESSRGSTLLWSHLAGLGAAWDAPLCFREGYAEEGDPPPPTSAEVPDRMLPADHDPDELLGVVQSYAGQVTLLDTCLGALLEWLDGSAIGNETLLVLTSPRGFALGEHRRIGACDDALFSELIHVPWIMRFPKGLGAGVRSQQLVEPTALWGTLLDWWQIPLPASPTARSMLPLAELRPMPASDRLCIRGSGLERGIRTPAWYLRIAEEPELYAKPDDRWEVNNVANRCQEVCECLEDVLAEYELMLPSGRVEDLPALSEVLLNGLG